MLCVQPPRIIRIREWQMSLPHETVLIKYGLSSDRGALDGHLRIRGGLIRSWCKIVLCGRFDKTLSPSPQSRLSVIVRAVGLSHYSELKEDARFIDGLMDERLWVWIAVLTYHFDDVVRVPFLWVFGDAKFRIQ
jgi:hypothetical protein